MSRVRNSQNLPRCSLSRSWRYFWTRKVNFICFHFSIALFYTHFTLGQPIFFQRGYEEWTNRRKKISSNTFHKGQIKVFFVPFLFTRLRFRVCFALACQFYVRLFSNAFLVISLVSFSSTNKNTPPTSLNTRITIKSFTKCLHQIFTVYGR